MYLSLQVVFSTTWWIGIKTDNPDEKQLAMPDSIVHTNLPGQPSIFDRPSPLAATGKPSAGNDPKTAQGNALHCCCRAIIAAEALTIGILRIERIVLAPCRACPQQEQKPASVCQPGDC